MIGLVSGWISQIDWRALGLSIASAILGIALKHVYELVREWYRFKKELRDNNFIDVTGKDWFAAWQAAVENELLVNTEQLCMEQKGNVVKVWNTERSPENPKGGYKWEAQMQFFQGRYLMGWYFPLREENLTSKGMMFVTYNSARRTFYGKWVGSAYDGDLCNGFVVISKNREAAVGELKTLIEKHKAPVNVISLAI